MLREPKKRVGNHICLPSELGKGLCLGPCVFLMSQAQKEQRYHGEEVGNQLPRFEGKVLEYQTNTLNLRRDFSAAK
jgi:hypothetical protein